MHGRNGLILSISLLKNSDFNVIIKICSPNLHFSLGMDSVREVELEAVGSQEGASLN